MYTVGNVALNQQNAQKIRLCIAKRPTKHPFYTATSHLSAYAGNNPVKYVDPTGMWTDEMASIVEKAFALDRTYTHGSSNANGEVIEEPWDCDVFVEYIIENCDEKLIPSTFKKATETTVAQHLVDMKEELKDEPSKGTNIVFHGGNHAMILSLNEDGTVDYAHISSTNKDEKAFRTTLPSLNAFEKYWSAQGNGDLKYVPLNDYKAGTNTPTTNNASLNEEQGSGK